MRFNTKFIMGSLVLAALLLPRPSQALDSFPITRGYIKDVTCKDASHFGCGTGDDQKHPVLFALGEIAHAINLTVSGALDLLVGNAVAFVKEGTGLVHDKVVEHRSKKAAEESALALKRKKLEVVRAKLVEFSKSAVSPEVQKQLDTKEKIEAKIQEIDRALSTSSVDSAKR